MLENKNTEFKREFVDEIKKTIVAFANTDGGTLYVGINDDGTVSGIEDTDTCMLKVANSIRDSVKPDISIFCEISTEVIDNKSVVKVEVQRGTARPYYIAGKGIRPEGVYVRQGASNAPATETAILNMIRETAGDNYEDARSLNQQLTFVEAENYFNQKNIPFGEQQKHTLKLIGDDKTYTNLALLLSDQCVHTIKFAVFDGTSKTTFKDRKEFSGSILKQLKDAYAYIDMFNHTHAEFEGLNRIDSKDYPVEAIREALLNAIVHREYGFSSSTLISIFDDRIEFVTIGGLVKGVTKNDIMLGVSILRNRNLADVFYRLKLIEAYGIGMPKIQDSYAGCNSKPIIEISDNAFKITLPNINSVKVPIENKTLTKREKLVIELFNNNEFVTRAMVQDFTGCSQTTAITTLANMVKKNLLVKTGNGADTKYIKA
ncbi:MAG: putative DNA binding domain-containing protein [Acutalibacteraceae bacterium]|nr:putative DNA binding domain-containing protein [Acutalibacteraceae bacterium]